MDRIAFVSRGSGGQPRRPSVLEPMANTTDDPRDIWKKKKGKMPFGKEAA